MGGIEGYLYDGQLCMGFEKPGNISHEIYDSYFVGLENHGILFYQLWNLSHGKLYFCM